MFTLSLINRNDFSPLCSSRPKFNEIRFCLGPKILRRLFRDYTEFSWELVVKCLENVLI